MLNDIGRHCKVAALVVLLNGANYHVLYRGIERDYAQRVRLGEAVRYRALKRLAHVLRHDIDVLKNVGVVAERFEYRFKVAYRYALFKKIRQYFL